MTSRTVLSTYTASRNAVSKHQLFQRPHVLFAVVNNFDILWVLQHASMVFWAAGI